MEICIYKTLYQHFTKYLCANQNGCVKKRSILSNMLSFLKQIYEAIDYSVDNQALALYIDFQKAFDRVPHSEMLKNVSNIGVGGFILEVLLTN